jgi:hypothetical protein
MVGGTKYYYLSRCWVLMNARDWKLVFRNHRVRQWMAVYLTFLSFSLPARPIEVAGCATRRCRGGRHVLRIRQQCP